MDIIVSHLLSGVNNQSRFNQFNANPFKANSLRLNSLQSIKANLIKACKALEIDSLQSRDLDLGRIGTDFPSFRNSIHPLQPRLPHGRASAPFVPGLPVLLARSGRPPHSSRVNLMFGFSIMISSQKSLTSKHGL